MTTLFRASKNFIFGCSSTNSIFIKSTRGVFSTLSAMSEEIKSVAPSTVENNKDERVVNKRQTRYIGRLKKRKWEDTPMGDEVRKRIAEGIPFVRIKRRKVVILLGYSGADYYGMQRNPGVNTIEEDFLKALLNTENISLEQFNQIQELNFQRAARTDKGVSAARQIVSMKLDPDADVAKINESLPPVINVFAIKRVTKGFDAKRNCNARTYTYTLPTYAFESHSTVIEDHIAFRTTTEKISHINEILEVYKGCKNYHNYTSKIPYINPTAKRFMLDFKCDKVFEADGMEFAVLKVQGQSFLMHQIRKMVGMALAIVRGLTTVETLHKTFGPEVIDIPTAPGLGLVLDYVHYTQYNARYGKDGMHSSITWDALEDKIEQFKRDFIYPSIIGQETREKPMAIWLEHLHRHSYLQRDENAQINPDEPEEPESDAEEDGGSDLENNEIIGEGDNINETKSEKASL